MDEGEFQVEVYQIKNTTEPVWWLLNLHAFIEWTLLSRSKVDEIHKSEILSCSSTRHFHWFGQ